MVLISYESMGYSQSESLYDEKTKKLDNLFKIVKWDDYLAKLQVFLEKFKKNLTLFFFFYITKAVDVSHLTT